MWDVPADTDRACQRINMFERTPPRFSRIHLQCLIHGHSYHINLSKLPLHALYVKTGKIPKKCSCWYVEVIPFEIFLKNIFYLQYWQQLFQQFPNAAFDIVPVPIKRNPPNKTISENKKMVFQVFDKIFFITIETLALSLRTNANRINLKILLFSFSYFLLPRHGRYFNLRSAWVM